ncbi:MAG: peptide deformylase [Spirochaetes bacterium]|nr:peptide deformylase [Spirochaetota bacterium]
MLKIITYGDKLLTQKSELITDINTDTIKLIEEMFNAMYYNNGIGLAAVQVGQLLNLFVVDVPDFGKYVMINPKILDKSFEKNSYEEGCLSVPGIGHDVERPANIIVEYTDEKGKNKKIEASGLLSTCIQHEYDHLEGILFIDRLDPEERLKKISEYTKLHIV